MLCIVQPLRGIHSPTPHDVHLRVLEDRSKWPAPSTEDSIGKSNNHTGLNNYTARKDQTYGLGSTIKATDKTSVMLAYYHTETKVAGLNDGERDSVVAIAEYALSKQVQVYGEVDYIKANGAARVDLNTYKSRTTTMFANSDRSGVGIRYRF